MSATCAGGETAGRCPDAASVARPPANPAADGKRHEADDGGSGGESVERGPEVQWSQS